MFLFSTLFSMFCFLMQCSLLFHCKMHIIVFWGSLSLADGILFPDRIPESGVPGCARDRGCKLSITSRRAL